MNHVTRYIITRINCLRTHIPYKSQLFIDRYTHIKGGRRIALGNGVKIGRYTMLIAHDDGKIEIGEGSDISMFSRIGSHCYVKIGRNVLTGPHVFIADYNHAYSDVAKSIIAQGDDIRRPQDEGPCLSIGDDSWIGTNVCIAGNIHIGRHCVIGANSVVTHDVPDYCVAAGTPCKVIKHYDAESQCWVKD